jgi:hypothetical protein
MTRTGSWVVGRDTIAAAQGSRARLCRATPLDVPPLLPHTRAIGSGLACEVCWSAGDFLVSGGMP